MEKTSDGKLAFIRFARVITYLIYAYFLIATVFLVTGFILLLFGANSDTPFVRFVYHFAAEFLQPFRGIFPVHQISDRSYFSASGLFAIIFYGLSAMAIHVLISYLTLKMTAHQKELAEANQQHYAKSNHQNPHYQSASQSYANPTPSAYNQPKPPQVRTSKSPPVRPRV